MNGGRLWLLPFLPFALSLSKGERGLNQSFFERVNLMRLRQTAGTLNKNELARINPWHP